MIGSQIGEPVDNLAIGRIVEVDGSHIVAELDADLTELSRIYAGEVYPIGQYGSIVRVHFGRRIIYAFVGRLRMKAEYEAERGIQSSTATDERIIEADLFGEGEWLNSIEGNEPTLKFERGVATFPLPQQTLYLTPKSELRYIYAHRGDAAVLIGEHVGAAGAPCYADLNELIGKHTAILGSTGSGKSSTVAAIVHSILEKEGESHYNEWFPRIIILDPHNEYGKAFQGHSRLSTDEGTLLLPYWLLSLNETYDLLIGATEFAATSQANIIKNALLDVRISSARQLKLVTERVTVDSPIPYELGNPSGLDDFGQKDGQLYSTGLGPVHATASKAGIERIELVIAREYSSIPLQSTEQALHFIPPLVQLLVLPRVHATFQGWNNRREPHIERHQRRIPPLWPQPVEQFAPLRSIVGLARRERER